MTKSLFEAVTDEERIAREQDTFDVLSYGKCRCGNPGTSEHTCPYSEDIHGDSTTLCNCCRTCEGNCADDI